MAARRVAAAALRLSARTTAAGSESTAAPARLLVACQVPQLAQLACGALVRQWRGFSPAAVQHAAPGGQLYGGQTLEEIRSRIFGTHIGSGLPSGRKLLRKKLVGEKIASYYEVPIGKTDPLFESLDDERCA